MAATAIAARIDGLRRDVAGEKKTIHDARLRLQAKASQLAELEAHAARLGLALHFTPGVGGIHGRPDPDRTRTDA